MTNRIYKITEASEYLGVSINTLKTIANNGKIKSFKTTGEHRRFRKAMLTDTSKKISFGETVESTPLVQIEVAKAETN